jgi:hypothetical protein
MNEFIYALDSIDLDRHPAFSSPEYATARRRETVWSDWPV